MLAVVAGSGPALTLSTPDARAGTLWVTACSGFGDSGSATDLDGTVWQGVGDGSFSTANRCAQRGSFQILPSRQPHTGDSVQWHTVTPPSIQIVHAVTPDQEVLIDPTTGDGFHASFFWHGGSQAISPQSNCCGGMDYGTPINRWIGPSRWFGWQVTCVSGPCGEPLQILNVRGVELAAVDNTPPLLVALGSNNVWYQGARYLRGAGWSASWQASADDGICGMQAIVDGQAIPGPSSATLNQHSWTQCPTPVTMPVTLDTARYPDGSLSLTLFARDAASPANVSSPTQTLRVDNTPVGLTLSGPTDAPSTAGTQHVTASATAGPSSVAGIDCSTDGSPYQWYPGSTTEVPVAGIGPHQVVCDAQNNSFNVDGQPATSPTQTWRLSIRQPTVISASFAKLVDALRCSHRIEHLRVPSRWVKVHRHGKVRYVHRRGHRQTVSVLRCHPRLVRERERVHGGWRTVRVPVFPHVVQHTARRVRHGSGTTVSGWLGTSGGTALGGQQVSILTAPDNGLEHFTRATVATTGANGVWTATLRPGPSRLVEAFYAGGSTTEPAASAYAHLAVPAKIRLSISPRWVAWTGTIALSGRLLGGYVPADGVALWVRVGYPGGPVTLHALRTNPRGAFRFSWSFGSGSGIVTWPLWVATVSNESDYAYAAASSRHIAVRFGGDPPPPRSSHRHRRHRRR